MKKLLLTAMMTAIVFFTFAQSRYVEGLVNSQFSESVSLQKVRNIHSDSQLRDVAIRNRYERVRLEAVRRMHTDSHIRDVGRARNQFESVSLAAVSRMHTDSHIRDVAMASRHESVSLEAVSRIHTDRHIRDVAMTSRYESVSLAAVRRMHTDSHIRDVAMASQYESVWRAAIGRMHSASNIRAVEERLNSQPTSQRQQAQARQQDGTNILKIAGGIVILALVVFLIGLAIRRSNMTRLIILIVFVVLGIIISIIERSWWPSIVFLYIGAIVVSIKLIWKRTINLSGSSSWYDENERGCAGCLEKLFFVPIFLFISVIYFLGQLVIAPWFAFLAIIGYDGDDDDYVGQDYERFS